VPQPLVYGTAPLIGACDPAHREAEWSTRRREERLMPDAREFFAHLPTTAHAGVSALVGLPLIMEGPQPSEL
jgi:hypothetical protein